MATEPAVAVLACDVVNAADEVVIYSRLVMFETGIDTYYTMRYALMCAVRDDKVDKSKESEWDTPGSDCSDPIYKQVAT